MEQYIYKTAGYMCRFVSSEDGLRPDMKNDSSGNWWKYAILVIAGVAAGSSVTYLIMKDRNKKPVSMPVAQNIQPSQSLKQNVCKNGGGAAEEDKVTEPETVMKTASDTTNEVAEKVDSCIVEEKGGEEMASRQDEQRPEKATGEQVRKPYFRSPVLFAELPDKKKVLHKLYKNLKDYMSCSSLEYFLYIFGDRLGNYQPSDNDFIDWTGGKYSLQSLIIKLYKPDGAKSVPRGTWGKVEEIFLMHGKRIPPKTMKLETNHIPEKVRNAIDQIVESSLNLPRRKPSRAKTPPSNATYNLVQS